MRVICPGGLVENAYIEGFIGKVRDECLNDHYFMSVPHAKVVIEAWRCEDSDERPRRVWAG